MDKFHIEEMEGHHCIYSRNAQDNMHWFATCDCGSQWTQSKEKTKAYVIEIYRSHLAYFKKPATMVL